LTILIREGSGSWREPASSGYLNEADLQGLLLAHPNLIPGVDGDVAVCAEFQSAVGPADLLVIDGSGAITIVECKLAGNPEVRRRIVGQILDYASRLWKLPVAELESRWVRATRAGQSPFDVVDDDDGRLREAVQRNLDDGSFQLVLAVDSLNEDLKRMVEYLNHATLPSISVVAVEYARAREGLVEILIPNVYGTELAEAKAASGAGRRERWGVDDVTSWTSEHDPDGLDSILTLIQELGAAGFGLSGGRALTPSMNASITVAGVGQKWPVSVYTDAVRGALIEVRFPDFKMRPDIAERMVAELESIEGIPIPLAEVRSSGFSKRPNLAAREFTPSMVKEMVAGLLRAWA